MRIVHRYNLSNYRFSVHEPSFRLLTAYSFLSYAILLLLFSTQVGKSPYQLSFKQEGQLDEPGYSYDIRRILSILEEAYDIKTIFKAVRKFYVASILKIRKSLFRDSWLKDIGDLQPERTASYL